MRKFITFIFSALFFGLAQWSAAQVDSTIVQPANFSSGPQSMWTPGSAFSLNFTQNLFDVQWNESGSTGGISNLGGFQFGGSIGGGTSGRIASDFVIEGFSSGEVEVDYPINAELKSPKAFSFNSGQSISLKTKYNVAPGYSLQTTFPTFGRIALELKVRMNFFLNMQFCLFACTGNIPVLPNVGFPLQTFPIFEIDALTNPGTVQVTTPCFYSPFPYLPAVPGICTSNVTPYVFSNPMVPISGMIDLPSVQTTDQLGSNKKLKASGEKNYLGIYVDIFGLLSEAANLIPPPPGPVISNVLGNLSNSYTEPVTGITAYYNVFSASFNVNNTLKQQFEYSPNINVGMKFSTPVTWNIEDGNTGAPLSTPIISDSASFSAGDNVNLNFPCNFDFVDVTPYYEITNTFSNETYDSLSFDFTLSALGFGFDVPTTPITPRICFPRVCLLCPKWCSKKIWPGIRVSYPCGVYSCNCWTPPCIPALTFPGLSFNLGPLWSTLLPVAHIKIPYFQDSWSLPMSGAEQGNTFRIRPKKMSVSATPTAIACKGDSTGQVAVNITNGSPPYSIDLASGQSLSQNATSATFTNLVAGSETVMVTDNNGCQTVAPVHIDEPLQTLSFQSVSKDDVDCFGASTGNVFVTAQGGTPNYTYTWNHGPTTQNATNLSAGSYALTVTDANSCVIDTSIVIDEPLDLAVTDNITSVDCKNNSTGAIDITVSGGSLPYSFSWSDGSALEDQLNLSAGSYTVTITDANACELIHTYLVNEPLSILSLSGNTTDVNCFGDATGAIDQTTFGGTAPYVYTWSGAANQVLAFQSEDLNNISAANYSTTVTDANGCTASQTYGIIQPVDSLSVSLSETDVLCFGDNTGAATAAATGGTSPYNYNWNNGSSGASNTSLNTGNYTVTVVDDQGCSISKTVFVDEPNAPLAVSSSNTNIDCFGDATGQVDLTVSGGTGSYNYAWNNGSTSQDLTTVTAGTYSVTVTDGNACEVQESYTLTEPAAPLTLSESITDVACFDALTGQIDVTTAGGTAPYNYVWSNNSNQVLATNSEDLINQAAGSFSLNVTDDNGCVISDNYTIQQPAAPLSHTVAISDVLCFGGASGSIVSTPSGGTSPYSYNWSNGASTAAVGTLSANDYLVTITDDQNCTFNDTLTVEEPNAPLQTNLASTDVLCFGNITGAIDATTTGGTLPYAYVWSNGSSNEDLTGLTAGSYTLTVTDANGCTTVESQTIHQPAAPLSLVESLTDVSCFGFSDGQVDLSLAGGTQPYTIQWSNSNGTVLSASGEDLNNVTADDYTISITDNHGCMLSDTFSIQQPNAPLSNTFAVQEVLCHGDATGSINSAVSGGTLPYVYAWSNSASTSNVSGLTANDYTLSVTDNNGCLLIDTASVIEPTNPLGIASSVTNVACFGDATGNVDITVSGGTSGYTYNWSNGSNSEDIQFLAQGSYTVTVTDQHACTETATVNVSQPAAPLSSSGITTAVLCYGGNNGAIDLTVNGGTTPYNYQWADGNQTVLSSSNQDLTVLFSDQYSLTITDDNNCVLLDTFTITQPAAPLEIGLTKTDVNCFGSDDGTIQSTVVGGTLPYNYIWNNAITGPNQNAVSANTYSLTVTDANGCQSVDSIQVSQPAAPLTLTASTTDILCFGDQTGEVDLTVSGGTSGYSYNWNNGVTGQDLNGVPAGNYDVIVTDANGCLDSLDFNLIQPNAPVSITSAVDHVNCFGDNSGAVHLNTSGGTSPYQYAWNNGSGIMLNQLNEDLLQQPASNYAVTVTDNHGCTLSDSFNVSQPSAPLSVNLVGTDIRCHDGNDGAIQTTTSGGTTPYSYQWNTGNTGANVQLLNTGMYQVTVVDVNGCSIHDSIFLSEPQFPLSAQDTVYDVQCFGGADGSIEVFTNGGTTPYDFNWSNGANTPHPKGLTANSYSVTITDLNGCSLIQSSLVEQPAAPISISAAVDAVDCFEGEDGSVSLTVNGGTAPYNYKWSDGTNIINLNGPLLDQVSQGVYHTSVTDANGCLQTITNQVNEPTKLLATASAFEVNCFNEANGRIKLMAEGGIPPYNFNWSNGALTQNNDSLTANAYSVTITDQNNCSFGVQNIAVNQPDPLQLEASINPVSCLDQFDGAINLSAQGGVGIYSYRWTNYDAYTSAISQLYPGSYSVELKDGNGCTLEETFEVDVMPDECLEIPNTFTPNGDGTNDTWQIKNAYIYDGIVVRIFNKWGNLLFESKGYQQPWDGNFNSNVLPVGTYYYVIEPAPGMPTKTGTITIVR